MSTPSTNRSLVVILSVACLVVALTYGITVFARGYQINYQNGLSIKSTGLLSATSKPKSASVFVNNRLITATDDTLNLPPGEYRLKIAKDGYFPWEKTIKIKKETVFQSDAQLFRSATDLKPLTFSGVINPANNLDNTKIVYAVASASASQDNGLYLLELPVSPLNITRNYPRQIARNFSGIDWHKFIFTFSPNSNEILAESKTSGISYLLSLNQSIDPKNLYDVTVRLPLIKEEWSRQLEKIISAKVDKLPTEFKSVISTASAQHLIYSPQDDKIAYLSYQDTSLPTKLLPTNPAQSTQKQDRDIKKGYYYVYDLKDDTNFQIGDTQSINNLQWASNTNLIFTQNQTLKSIEYDATNQQTLFAGDFNPNLVLLWNDGSKIITSLSLYQNAPQNIYSITIR